MKKFANRIIIIFTSLLAACEVLFLGLIFLSYALSSFSIGLVGITSSAQVFLEFFFVAIFVAVLFYFIKTKQKGMIITSLIGLASHVALLMFISKSIS
ncbi:hypothetical protein [Desulfosporosinus lacus]|uniref:Uncharacterized protein n=1 Tax=Desulfosporosinus lacus DSM 15449 TaxID=1121420 RepID=A0A1M5SEZ7_9FIRM|nr:hypothetical protein [Desulfosporosinus lacus]MDA8228214.1 hypothetical protein [Desulfitobacterium hafniense]SHH37015.1 hypothetical protein SAMN02746098_00829 [Desulfosporosinus lacus DSM 15449]